MLNAVSSKSLAAASGDGRGGQRALARVPARGFTMIEMLIALAVASVLSMIAVPSFQSQLQRVRRSDAMVAMIKIQLAQAQWRANSTAYGSLADIGAKSVSDNGHYALRITRGSPDSYTVIATAIGTQAADTPCRVLKIEVQGLEIARASGPDAATGNDADANRRCWGL